MEKIGFVSCVKRKAPSPRPAEILYTSDLFQKALNRSEKSDYQTDDSMLVEIMGAKVKIVKSTERNIKITSPIDLKVAEILLKEAENDQNRDRI